MDFTKIIGSIDELLYEAMVTLVFFPRTLWLILRHPQKMMDYADTELGDVLSAQYDDTLSPALFLAICIGINYVIAHLIGNSVATDALPVLFRNWQNMLAFRIFAVSLFPLLMALRLLKGRREPLNRETLRAPFYSQCFVAGPFALATGLMQSLYGAGWISAGWLAVALSVVVGWYLTQQTLWFRAKMDGGLLRATSMAVTTMLLATVTVFLFGAMLVVGKA